MSANPPAPQSALPTATPHDIRDELTIMVVNDLLGPAGGPDEELDQREDHAYGRDLVGLLAPKAVIVSSDEMDELGTGQKDDPEVGKSDTATPPADTLFPNSIGLSFVVDGEVKSLNHNTSRSEESSVSRFIMTVSINLVFYGAYPSPEIRPVKSPFSDWFSAALSVGLALREHQLSLLIYDWFQQAGFRKHLVGQR